MESLSNTVTSQDLEITGSDNEDSDDENDIPASVSALAKGTEPKTTRKSKSKITTPVFVSAAYDEKYRNLLFEADNIKGALRQIQMRLKNAERYKRQTEENISKTKYFRTRNGTVEERTVAKTRRITSRGDRMRLGRLEEQVKVARAAVEVFDGKMRDNQEQVAWLIENTFQEEDEERSIGI
jgi:hypothetical protein